jgi:hypothetical protein
MILFCYKFDIARANFSILRVELYCRCHVMVTLHNLAYAPWPKGRFPGPTNCSNVKSKLLSTF